MKTYLRLITSSIAMVLATSVGAAPMTESEPNDGIAKADVLVGPTAVVTGSLPKAPDSDRYDIDFFEFTTGNPAKTIKVRVKSCTPAGAATAALIDPDVKLVAQATFSSAFCNSTNPQTLTVDQSKLTANHKYVIALTTGSVSFNMNGDGGYEATRLANQLARDYEMTVEGLELPEIAVETVIKPNQGQGNSSHINLKSKGAVRFAILDTDAYDVSEIDPASLKLGATGSEDSVIGCDKQLSDVNGDALDDMVCRFDVNYTNFTTSSREAVLKGKMKSGKDIKSTSKIKVTALDEK